MNNGVARISSSEMAASVQRHAKMAIDESAAASRKAA